MPRPLANSYWVLPGSLLAGEYPGDAPGDSRERLAQLLAAGIDTFIDLTQAGERPEYCSLLPAHVQYLRLPIVDAQAPADFEQMREIQRHLQSALAVGRCVYVHCRAGIGRTGTVIGCFLAEQGLDGAAALRRLNQLWRQSARSASWPDLPQTTGQAEFIIAWPQHRQLGAQAPALMALRGLRGRFLGSLLGLAVGDALGAAAGRGFEPWTDDTALTLCLAESLLESGGFDAQDQWLRYARWRRDGHLSARGRCLGLTAATAQALALAHPAGAAMQAESGEPAPLSRVAAAVLFNFAVRSEAIAQARAAAQFSQASPLVRDACALLAAMLHAALRGEPLGQVLRAGARPAAGAPEFDARVLAIASADPALPPPPSAQPVLAVLGSARWALANGGDFRAGALLAARLADDADVIGAVHGQLAGAVYGYQGIPVPWLDAVARRPLLEQMAERLLTRALS
jgi:ADP-ribosylglycohydrolase